MPDTSVSATTTLTFRDGVGYFAPDETGLYPVTIGGQKKRAIAYVWAASEADAIAAVKMPPNRCPRYWSERAARDAQAFGDDGYDGDHLFRLSLEVL